MISLVIIVEAAPERADDFARFIAEEAADSVANEPGCRQFTVSRGLEQTNLFTLAEFYDDQAALDAHRLTPHFILFQERVKEFNLVIGKTVVLGEVIQG
jgi:(4S)-4-hydroxy-5-phosphonooxypentane-2,3-dione isomerase